MWCAESDNNSLIIRYLVKQGALTNLLDNVCFFKVLYYMYIIDRVARSLFLPGSGETQIHNLSFKNKNILILTIFYCFFIHTGDEYLFTLVSHCRVI